MANITSANIKQIRADVEAALKTIYAKHGVDVTVGRITYCADNFRCKIEGNVRGASAATPANPKTAALSKYAFLLGNTFDETKSYNIPSLGRIKVTGYNTRARQYPFVVKQVSTGKQYKVSTMSVKAAIDNGAVA